MCRIRRTVHEQDRALRSVRGHIGRALVAHVNFDSRVRGFHHLISSVTRRGDCANTLVAPKIEGAPNAIMAALAVNNSLRFMMDYPCMSLLVKDATESRWTTLAPGMGLFARR